MKNIRSLFSFSNNCNFQNIFTKHVLNLTRKNFALIKLRTHTGNIEFTHNLENTVSIKNYLSKNWILVKDNFKYNKISRDSSFTNIQDENTLISGIGKITTIDFERFATKTGLGISNSETVYIEDLVFKGKKIRVIGSNPEDIARVCSLAEENANFASPDILLLLNNTENSEKRFILFEKTKKVILTNSKSGEKIKKVLTDISE